MMWLNDGMHGRADKTSRTYVKAWTDTTTKCARY